MGYAVKIYEAFRDLGEEKAQILADFVEYVESRKSATSAELKETELRLTKEIEATRLEIEQVRKEIKEIEGNLRKEIKEVEANLKLEIEKVRKEIKEVEANLKKEIKEVELKLTKEIEKSKSETIKWMFLFWIGQVVSVIAIIKWLFIH